MSKKRKKNDNLISASHKAVKGGIKKVKRAKSGLDSLIEVVAFITGIVGFVALVGLGVLWGWHEIAADSYPDLIPTNKLMPLAIIAVFCASFTGWLIVNDGQDRLEKKTHRLFAVIVFGLLPLVCLAATVFPDWIAETFSLPSVDSDKWHSFWVFVRFYPLLLIFICLWVAFKRDAKPRKYFKKKRALKFLLLAAPYIVVLIFQELSLKATLVQDATDATLGSSGLNMAAAGVNIQLIMALMTGSRYD